MENFLTDIPFLLLQQQCKDYTPVSQIFCPILSFIGLNKSKVFFQTSFEKSAEAHKLALPFTSFSVDINN